MDENVYNIVKQVQQDIAQLGSDSFVTEEAKLRMARNEAKLKVLVDFFYMPGTPQDPETRKNFMQKILP